MAATSSTNRLLPSLAVRAVGLWVAAGAFFKLLAGTPADLPQLVRDVPLGLGLTYKLVIGIELVVVVTALLKPRLGWPLAALQLLAFDAVLAVQLSAGDTNCGCFGSKVTMSPWVMLGIDTALLALLLAGRPWSGLRARGAPAALVALLAAAGVAAPWVLDREADPAARRGATEPAPPAGETPAAPSAAAEEAEEAAPKRVEWTALEPLEWVGKNVMETELYDWLPEGTVEGLPPDAEWVLYRESCDHCAAHLEELARTDDGSRFLVLVQVPEERKQTRVVYVMPTGGHVFQVSLVGGIDYVVTTPAEMQVEEYVVKSARDDIPLPEEG